MLLIDDDELILDCLSELLDVKEFKLHLASYRAEGIAKISNGIHPNLVIIDILQPNKDALEIIHRIRDFTGEEIPIIILTDDSYGVMTTTIGLNKCIVLHKPNEMDKLISHIQEMAA